MTFDSIIIGAGISGLVAANRLKKLGSRVLLIEGSDHVGGVIQSREADGFLIELGPNSMRGTNEFLDLIEELDLNDELVTADPNAPAYVYSGGELHAVPMSPQALVKSRLISNSAKLRLLREPFIKARGENGEETISSFVRRRLGGEILEKLVEPFLSGVYAGSPEQLSIQACFPKLAGFEAGAGSILRGALTAGRSRRAKPKRSLRAFRLCSFRRGLQTLPLALAKILGDNLLTDAEIIDIEKSESSPGYRIAFEHNGERKIIGSATLIIATPALAAANLLERFAPDISSLISEIPYASIASVPLAYRAEQVSRNLDGFGFLAPRSEGLRILGSIWNSSLFDERSPEGWVCATNFIGGTTDPEAVDLTDDELVSAADKDLCKVLGIEGEPRKLPITRYHRAIPQYNIGHAARVAKVEAAMHNHPGLRLAGNYLRGVSLGDCIVQSERIAVEVKKR